MKKQNLWFLLVLMGTLILNSCEEGLNFDVDTTITKKLNADIQAPKKSGNEINSFAFSDTDTLNIEDNESVKENLEKMKGLNITKVTCQLTGIPDGEKIEELNIAIPEALINIMLNDITENGALFTLDITDELLDAAEQFLLDNHKISLMVSGFSSYAPMTLGVELNFETTISVGILGS